MPIEESKTQHAIIRLIPPLAVWAIGKLLETPNVKGALQEVDSHAFLKSREVQRSVKRAGKNAMDNAGWLVAGAAAIIVGIGLMARATRKK